MPHDVQADHADPAARESRARALRALVGVPIALVGMAIAWHCGSRVFGLTYGSGLEVGYYQQVLTDFRDEVVVAGGIVRCPTRAGARERVLAKLSPRFIDYFDGAKPLRWIHTPAGLEVWLYDCTLTPAGFDGGVRQQLSRETSRLLWICAPALLILDGLLLVRLLIVLWTLIRRVIDWTPQRPPAFACARPAHQPGVHEL